MHLFPAGSKNKAERDTTMPPNQPRPENVNINVRISRFAKAQVKKLAKQSNVHMSALIRSLLEHAVEDVELTETERAEVIEEIRKASQS